MNQSNLNQAIPKQADWQVYIIEASDSKLYTGITTNIAQRWQKHTNGKGAKFFRGRSPEYIRYLEHGHTKSSASKREIDIKKMTRREKIQLIKSNPYLAEI